MDYKVYKIYDPEISNVVVGVHVADCMTLCNTDETKKNVEECMTAKLKDLTISNVLNCSYCKISFNDTVEQRNHYKLDWHRYNLKRGLNDKSPVTEDAFDTMADDVSSISGSDSETSDKEDSDSESNDVKETKDTAEASGDSKLTTGRHSKAFFENSDNKIFSVYKCLLHAKKDTVSNSSLISALMGVLESPKKWLVVMLGGGHFAAAIFNNKEIAEHKTFHCYTVRAKQGSSQSSRDNKGAGHPKSAGASLRRYNEQALVQHVQEILSNWSESMKQCNLIFYRATGRHNRGVIFGGKNPPFVKSDPRLRNIPFPTKRATFKEVNRVHDILSSLEVYGPADKFKDKYPRSPDKRSTSRKNDPNAVDEGQESPDNAKCVTKKTKRKIKIDRSKARSSPDREIPGENINVAFHSDSSDDKDDEQMFLASSYVDIALGGLREFDENWGDEVADSSDSDSGKGKPRRRKRKTKTPFDRQFRDIQKKLVDSCENEDKDLLVETLKIYESLPDVIDADNKTGNYMTKGDFMNCINTSIGNEQEDTILHLSASYSLAEFTTLLLEAGADPTIKNKYGFRPYAMAASKETRNAFKQFVSKYPDKVNYKNADIPSPISEEKQQMLDEKKKEKNRMRRQKDRIKKRAIREMKEEEEDKQKFLALSDMEKRALAVENRVVSSETANEPSLRRPVLSRCFLCGMDITGKVPFEYDMNKFCSIPCVKAHRQKTNSYGLNI